MPIAQLLSGGRELAWCRVEVELSAPWAAMLTMTFLTHTGRIVFGYKTWCLVKKTLLILIYHLFFSNSSLLRLGIERRSSKLVLPPLCAGGVDILQMVAYWLWTVVTSVACFKGDCFEVLS